jgi:hypothetical protein
MRCFLSELQAKRSSLRKLEPMMGNNFINLFRIHFHGSVPLQYGSVPDRHNSVLFYWASFIEYTSFIVGFKVRNLGNYLVAAR